MISNNYTVDSVNSNNNEYELNFGLQPHSLTNSVLRLILKLKGEEITCCTPFIGFTHKAIEKKAENISFSQIYTLLTHLNSTDIISYNYAFILALERLTQTTPPKRAMFLRTIFAEIARIHNHIRIISAMAQDLGSDIPFIQKTKQEKFTNQFLHNKEQMFQVGGISFDISDELLSSVYQWANKEINNFLESIDYLLTNNHIFKTRTKNIGVISQEQALSLGLSGVPLRASGISYDVRKAFPYDAYPFLDFNIPTMTKGDCYARYLLRVEEIKESIKIILQAIDNLPLGDFNIDAKQEIKNKRKKQNKSINEETLYVPAGEIYQVTESPKGELGIYILSDGKDKPYRLHIKAPSFNHIESLSVISGNNFLGDMVSIIGSLDLSTEEADR